MTITILTLIVLTLGNGYYLVRQHRIIKGISRLQKIHTVQIDNYGAKIYDLEFEWTKFNKSINNTKLLKLFGLKKYSKKK